MSALRGDGGGRGRGTIWRRGGRRIKLEKYEIRGWKPGVGPSLNCEGWLLLYGRSGRGSWLNVGGAEHSYLYAGGVWFYGRMVFVYGGGVPQKNEIIL